MFPCYKEIPEPLEGDLHSWTLLSYADITLSEPQFSIYEIRLLGRLDAVVCISHLI